MAQHGYYWKLTMLGAMPGMPAVPGMPGMNMPAPGAPGAAIMPASSKMRARHGGRRDCAGGWPARVGR